MLPRHAISPERNLANSTIISFTVMSSRMMRVTLVLILAFLALLAATQGASNPLEDSRRVELEPGSAEPSPVIIVGFVGGFVRHDNAVHSEVKLAARLRKEFPEGVYVQVFENRHRKQALQAILRHLEANSSY